MLPEEFTILVRKEGDLYVSTVAEFPNVTAHEETFRDAFEIVVDAICTLRDLQHTGNAV